MDRVELGIKIEQMEKLYKRGEYEQAAAVADGIDWRKVKKLTQLSLAADVYEAAKDYGAARDMCTYAYNRNLGGRRLIYRMTMLSIAMNDVEEAEDLYSEFVDLAPHDMSRYGLLFELHRMKEDSDEDLIRILEEYKDNELDEHYEYELACLYAKTGRIEECVKECDDLILWFNDGEYVQKALQLKKKYTELSKSQESKLTMMEDYEEAGLEYRSPQPVESPNELAMHAEHMQVPEKDYSVYDTRNIQAELAQSMKEILADMEEEEKAKKSGVPVMKAATEEQISDAMMEHVTESSMTVAPKEPEEMPASLKEAPSATPSTEIEDNDTVAENEDELSFTETVYNEPKAPTQTVVFDPKAVREAADSLQEKTTATDSLTTEPVMDELRTPATEPVMDELRSPATESAMEELRSPATEPAMEELRSPVTEPAMEELRSPVTEPAMEELGTATENMKQPELMTEFAKEALGSVATAPAIQSVISEDFEVNTLDPEEEEAHYVPSPEVARMLAEWDELEDKDPTGTIPPVRPRTTRRPVEEIPEEVLRADLEAEKARILAAGGVVDDAKVLLELASSAEGEPRINVRPAEPPINVVEAAPSPEALKEAKETVAQVRPSEEKIAFESFEETTVTTDPENMRVVEVSTEAEDDVDEPTKEIIINTHRWRRMRSEMEKEPLRAHVVSESEVSEHKAETQEPEAIEPETVEPETVEPETVEPETVESEIAEPEVAEVEVTEADAAEPEAAEPKTEEPEAAEPKTEEPEAADPKTEESEAAESEAVEPEAMEPSVETGEAIPGDEIIEGQMSLLDYLANMNEAVTVDPSASSQENVLSKQAAAVQTENTKKPEIAPADVSTGSEHGRVPERAYVEEAAREAMDELTRHLQAEVFANMNGMETERTQAEVAASATIETSQPEEIAEEAQQNESDRLLAKYSADTFEMSPAQKKFVNKYLFMQGMEMAITDLIRGKLEEDHDGTSLHGNIAIMGKADTDKATFAVDLFKAMHAKQGNTNLKVAKTTAEILNHRGIEATKEKIYGTTLILEHAGKLERRTILDLVNFMKGDTGNMLVIFTGEDFSVKRLLMEYPALGDMVDYHLSLRRHSSEELVSIAKEYAREKGYSIDEKAMVALYLEVGALKTEDIGAEIMGVHHIVDDAIKKCRKVPKPGTFVPLKAKYFTHR